MNKRLIPKFHTTSLFDVDLNKLVQLGYEVLFVDLDNTLSSPYVYEPDEKVIKLVNDIKKLGISIHIISNNHEPRVKKYADLIEVNYLFEVKKPKTFKVEEYIKNHQFEKSKCLVIGDQIMTDTLMGNRVGLDVLLVDPLTKQDEPITFFPRLLDKFFRSRINRKKLMKEF